MEIINQLAGVLAQSAVVARQQSTEKAQQIRRVQTQRKDVAAATDTFEHQVESTQELSPVHDDAARKDPGGKRQRRRPSQPETPPDAPSLDLTA